MNNADLSLEFVKKYQECRKKGVPEDCAILAVLHDLADYKDAQYEQQSVAIPHPPEGRCPLAAFIMEKDEGFNFQTYVYRVSKRQKNNLPTSWTEYCETNLTTVDYLKVQMPWIGHPAQYGVCSETRYYSEAFVALAKLIMLRDCYNGYTNPLKGSNQFYIDVDIREGKKGVHTFSSGSLDSRRTRCHILQFHTPELRDEFKKNFEDLIMEAAELLI